MLTEIVKTGQTWFNRVTGQTMDVYRVPLNAIGAPEPYIRKEMSGQRVNLMVTAVKGGENQKEQVNPADWPGRFMKKFPPLWIMRLSKPINVGKGDKARTIDFRTLDGLHRYMTALAIQAQTAPHGITADTVLAVISEPMSEVQSFTCQFLANNDGPLPFDREGRDFYIRSARKMGTPLAEIATATGLSEMSVSRIAKGMQGQSKEATSQARKAGAKKREPKKNRSKTSEKKIKTMNPGGEFFGGLAAMAAYAKKHKAAIVDYLKAKDSAWSSADALSRMLGVIRSASTGRA